MSIGQRHHAKIHNLSQEKFLRESLYVQGPFLCFPFIVPIYLIQLIPFTMDLCPNLLKKTNYQSFDNEKISTCSVMLGKCKTILAEFLSWPCCQPDELGNLCIPSRPSENTSISLLSSFILFTCCFIVSLKSRS